MLVKIAKILSILIGLLLSMGVLLINLNPFGFMFQKEISISNYTTETLLVTPLGETESAGRIYPLPRYALSVPTINAIKQGRYELEPGETMSVIYDWDDINFIWVLAEGKNRNVLFPVEPEALGKICCHPAKIESIEFNDIDSLPEAPSELVKAAHKYEYVKQNIITWIPLLSPFFLFLPWVFSKKGKMPNKSSHSPH